MRPICILALTFCTAAVAQEPSAQPPTKPSAATEAAAPRPTPPESLRAADEAKRPGALAAYVDGKIATGAVFSGQYAELMQLEWDAKTLLRGWLRAAPERIASDPVAFRVACINALRDCTEKASEELLAELQQLTTEANVPEALAKSAKFALAQFGKPELVDAMVQVAMKDTSSSDLNKKVDAWSQLADIYYNTRRYPDAAKAHAQVIRTIEAVRPDFRGLPASYYNCACSQALSGQKQEAIESLGKGLALGKKVGNPLAKDMVQSDMDLRSLRETPEFAKLMQEYFGIGEKKPDVPSEKGK